MKDLVKKFKLSFFTAGIILLLVVAFGIYLAYVRGANPYGNWNYATHPAYQIFIEKGQIPLQVTCTVLDSQGHPIPGMNVELRSYSGGHGEKVTDDQGQFTQLLPEREIVEITVNGIRAFDLLDSAWFQPRCMVLDEGLMIKIIMDSGSSLKGSISMLKTL